MINRQKDTVHLDCHCKSLNHAVRIEVEGLPDEYPLLTIRNVLGNFGGFWWRLGTAIRFLFTPNSFWLESDEFILDPDDLPDLVKVLTVYSDQMEKFAASCKAKSEIFEKKLEKSNADTT